jgi:hypothetical protein
MALAQYTAEVKDGLVLELPIEAVKLHLKAGDKVTIQLDYAGDSSPIGEATGLQAQFDSLAKLWHDETGFWSDMGRKAVHPAYQRIIGMGKEAQPLIFGEMAKEPGHWFWALRAITGENPVRQEHAGNVKAMTDDWLGWARHCHYV